MKGERFIYPVVFVIFITLIYLELNYGLYPQNNTMVIDLANRKAISVNVNCTVYIVEGDNERMVIEGSNRVLANLDIENENGSLSINCVHEVNYLRYLGLNQYSKNRLKISINHSDLDQLVIGNNAKIISSEDILSNPRYSTISISRLLYDMIVLNKI